jgi:hypothetical protein
MKRQRGRNRNRGNNGNNNNPNRSFDSNGPEVKVRGNAQTVYERYIQLARDSTSSGNRVRAENLLQHAEHYLRLNAELQAAHEKAKAERDAQRQKEREARGDRNDNRSDDDDGGNSRRRRNNNNRRRDEDQDSQSYKPEAKEPAPKAKKKPKVDEAATGLETITPEADAKSARRRRAPSRKKDQTPEAAE